MGGVEFMLMSYVLIPDAENTFCRPE